MDEHWLKTPGGKPRARSLGIPFAGRPGAWNAITDVPGVEVGYETLIEGDAVRTGVTAIHPRGRENARRPVRRGLSLAERQRRDDRHVVGPGVGHRIAGPSASRTRTRSASRTAAIVNWTAKHHPALAEAWLLPVAGETWDGYLNDINGGHVTVDTAVAALEAAASGPIEEGSVGGGTGMNCYGYKGGSTTASRVVTYGETEYTVGVLLQANFGARGRAGDRRRPAGCRPCGRRSHGPVLLGSRRRGFLHRHRRHRRSPPPRPVSGPGTPRRPRARSDGHDGVTFLGRSLPCGFDREPGRILPGAKSLYGEERGRLDRLDFIPWGYLDAFYEGVVQAVEEAVVDVLVVNDEMTGFRGHRTPGLPNERVVALLAERGVIAIPGVSGRRSR